MPAFDAIYETAVAETMASTEATVEALIKRLRLTGMSDSSIEEVLVADLDQGGPVFGKFLNDLAGASYDAVTEAQRQGVVIGAVASNPDVQRKIASFKFDIKRAEREPDPDLAFDIEEASGRHRELMWVAELVNTCHLCLPLHGIVLTGEEWSELGLHPSTIHKNAGFKSTCRCQLVETQVIADRDKALEPLRREKLPPLKKGERLNKRTVRNLASKKLETSLNARDELAKTVQGRRVLRKLGTVMDAEENPQPKE